MSIKAAVIVASGIVLVAALVGIFTWFFDDGGTISSWWQQVQISYTRGLFNDGIDCELDLIKNTERVKYCHPEYSDGEIDGLMKYFRFETYLEFLDFMRKHKRD